MFGWQGESWDQLHTLHMLSRVSVGHVRNTLEKYTWEIQLRNTIKKYNWEKYINKVQCSSSVRSRDCKCCHMFRSATWVSWSHTEKDTWLLHESNHSIPFPLNNMKSNHINPRKMHQKEQKSFQSWFHPRMCHPSVIQGSTTEYFFLRYTRFPRVDLGLSQNSPEAVRGHCPATSTHPLYTHHHPPTL